MSKLLKTLMGNKFLKEQFTIGNIFIDDFYHTPHVRTMTPTKVELEEGQTFLAWKGKLHYHYKKEGIVFDKNTFASYHLKKTK